jgi:hypothetical protein
MSANQGRVLCWFSCGAASARATALALGKYPREDVEILYCDTSETEHPDNLRFLQDCERIFEQPIKRLRSARFSTVTDVWDREQFVAGPFGASCTKHLKRNVRKAYQDPSDIHVLGFTADETKRVPETERDNPGSSFDWILIDQGVSKQDCLDWLRHRGVLLPAMYRMGYRNNNCIGCCKGSNGYWAKIRQDFPEIFEERCRQFEAIGFTPLKIKGERIPLRDLPKDYSTKTVKGFSCGAFCSKGEAE